MQAWNINCEPMNINRILVIAEQGDWARNQEVLMTKARWCMSGGCAVKQCDSCFGEISPYAWKGEDVEPV
jgi:hypothetical protein